MTFKYKRIVYMHVQCVGLWTANITWSVMYSNNTGVTHIHHL